MTSILYIKMCNLIVSFEWHSDAFLLLAFSKTLTRKYIRTNGTISVDSINVNYAENVIALTGCQILIVMSVGELCA